ncbi:hypothetical protein BJ138DRAFT_1131350 [Hygrophoropsis aurantiaca]|uniref:Uncharacterized protein n=1 Tax=Hygrophoropsis aurantiaca TaxID=72124 RepID=A0ACB7ZS12_9AGAM|nr:hypothetical protein BJ138DRAFT_1131350 [Hygrophoropsis aurantiaca]
MKLFSVFTVLAASVAAALGQTIELEYPTDGSVFEAGETLTAQVSRPNSIIGCTEVGIALATSSCNDEGCPDPAQRLGNVLYAGPFKPTNGYQNFTVTIPSSMNSGPAIFSLTHLCLLGGAPTPLLEFRNASISVE